MVFKLKHPTASFTSSDSFTPIEIKDLKALVANGIQTAFITGCWTPSDRVVSECSRSFQAEVTR
jgi:hypothetical protein